MHDKDREQILPGEVRLVLQEAGVAPDAILEGNLARLTESWAERAHDVGADEGYARGLERAATELELRLGADEARCRACARERGDVGVEWGSEHVQIRRPAAEAFFRLAIEATDIVRGYRQLPAVRVGPGQRSTLVSAATLETIQSLDLRADSVLAKAQALSAELDAELAKAISP